jgi:hypothetical protein
MFQSLKRDEAANPDFEKPFSSPSFTNDLQTYSLTKSQISHGDESCNLKCSPYPERLRTESGHVMDKFYPTQHRRISLDDQSNLQCLDCYSQFDFKKESNNCADRPVHFPRCVESEAETNWITGGTRDGSAERPFFTSQASKVPIFGGQYPSRIDNYSMQSRDNYYIQNSFTPSWQSAGETLSYFIDDDV